MLRLVKPDEKKPILDFFPPSRTPRPIQADAIEQIDAAFESGKRFVVFEGPPGLGKSLAAVTLARKYGRAFICTATKQLQAQYVNDPALKFLDIHELLGRGNFHCERARDTCAAGGVLFKHSPCGLVDDDGCAIGPSCPYKDALDAALNAPLTVCNYHSFWYVVVERALMRNFLVMDEAHSLEDVLLDHVSVSINRDKIGDWVMTPDLPGLDKATVMAATTNPAFRKQTSDKFFDWLEEVEKIMPEEINGDPKQMQEWESLVRKVRFAIRMRNEEEWIVEPSEEEGKGFELKPLTVKRFAPRLFRAGSRVLMMSATILDKDTMIANLGLDPADVAFVQAPCPFPKENRRVLVGNYNMTKAHRGRTWPLMVQTVEAILGDRHPKEKGLLLCPSNEMLRYIQAELSKRDRKLAVRILIATGRERMDVYRRHVTGKEPTVLGASGMWEGIDLTGESSRFQILPALPRPFWAGQVAARAGMPGGSLWYRWRTFTELIQGTGRSVRSETDHAVTYVMDGDLRREFTARDSLLPAWFKEALEFV